MARLKQRGDEVGLRECLLEQAIDFRDMYGHIDGCSEELSKPVDRLVGGEAHGFYRFQLPDDHPLRRVGRPGGMCDHFVLTENDVLMTYDDFCERRIQRNSSVIRGASQDT
jgi:hypothetical protein